MIKKLLMLCCVLGISSGAFAENYQYPLLLVTPSASERVQMEARQENANKWKTHLSVQIPALATLTAGLMVMGENIETKDDNKEAAKRREDNLHAVGTGAVIIGSAWLGATALMSLTYKPYTRCWQKLRRIKVQNQKDRLMRERLAEECLYDAASLGRKLAWLSVVSNFGAGAAVAATSEDDFNKVIGAVAAVASLTPLVFRYVWQEVADYHDDYKKRVYGPVANLGFIYRRTHYQGAAPVLQISWHL